MSTMKTISSIEVALLILAFLLSCFNCFLSGVVISLSNAQNLMWLPKSYLFLAVFIAAGLPIGILLKNELSLFIVGVLVVAAFVAIHYFYYKNTGTIGMSKHDFLYFSTLILLLINTVAYFVWRSKSKEYQ